MYDGLDRVVQQQYPLPAVGSAVSSPSDYEAFTYDANGNRLSVRRRDGQVIAFNYDNLNRMSVKQLPGATTGWVYYGYDNASRPTFAHFGSTAGSGVEYTYDSAKRVISESTFGHSLQYQYDLSGNRTRLTFPDGHYLQHDFDGLNRETQIREDGASSGAGILVSYGYDALSRNVSVTRGNGTGAGFGYDSASRLTSLSQNNAAAAQDVTFGFGYTLASQLQSRTGSNVLFDWLPTTGSQSYSRDGLDRYTAVGGATYSYDGRGNLTSDGTRTLAYDAENHLLSVSGGTAPITLSYDPLGRLTQSVVGNSTTQFVYDGSRLTAEYDGAGNLVRRYAHGPGTDNPEVWYEGATLTARNWLESDERGTVIATSDSTGTATVYTYGPYGEPTNWSGSRFRYTGQIALFEAKLYHYKARIYDPALGRFLQTDPIRNKDDFNLYTYVGNNPLNATDPSGMDCVSAGGVTTCMTANYTVSFPQQPGFQDFTTKSANYHAYSTPAATPGRTLQEDRQFVTNNPTPGFPSPATPQGTSNDATPVVGGLSPVSISPVKSFTLTNQKDGQPVVVNVTEPGHPLQSGIVVREPTQTNNGTVINNWGEGTAPLQAPGSRVGNEINSVWRDQTPPSPPSPDGCHQGAGNVCNR